MNRNGDIGRRFGGAFIRRTSPNTGVTLKMLENRTRISDATLARYRDNETTIPGEAIRAIDAAFAHYGFPGFLSETYGATDLSRVSSPSTNSAPPASPNQPAAGLGSIPAAAGDAGFSFDRHLWVTHERGVCLASRGHGDFARRFLDLPATTDADPRRFVIDQLGWIAVTHRSDGSIALDANAARINQDAASRLAAWLLERPQSTVRADCLGAGAIPAGEAAEIVRSLHPTLQAGGWQSERLPESEITDPAARQLWRAIHDAGVARANFLEIADNLGALDRCAVFLIGDGITSTHVGSALRVDRGAVLGRPIMARRDLDYARRLADDITRDRAEPSIREMRLADDTHYRRLTFVQPLGRDRWQAMTTSFDIVTPAGFVLA